MRAARIPVTVIGGFLGAGKTTLLNRLLTDNHDRRIAVLVNDFGAINIDADLVRSRDGDTISLTNGCICCGLGSEFMFALAGLRDREDPPEHVVVEASGIGDPATIAAFGDMPGFSRDAAIVVVDAETVRERARSERVGPQVMAQLRAAHLIVLNKTDLVDADTLAALRAWLHERFPYAGIVQATFGDVPIDVLLGARPAADAPARPPGAGHGHDHHHDHDHDHDHPRYASWSWSGDEPVHGNLLVAALPELPEGLLRAKGTLRLREDDSHRYVLQLAGRRWSIQAQRPWNEGEARASQVVFIGLPEAVLADDLGALIARLTA